jgi:hypothetical protein
MKHEIIEPENIYFIYNNSNKTIETENDLLFSFKGKQFIKFLHFVHKENE